MSRELKEVIDEAVEISEHVTLEGLERLAKFLKSDDERVRAIGASVWVKVSRGQRADFEEFRLLLDRSDLN